jgi:hypothetical protein
MPTRTTTTTTTSTTTTTTTTITGTTTGTTATGTVTSTAIGPGDTGRTTTVIARPTGGATGIRSITTVTTPTARGSTSPSGSDTGGRTGPGPGLSGTRTGPVGAGMTPTGIPGGATRIRGGATAAMATPTGAIHGPRWSTRATGTGDMATDRTATRRHAGFLLCTPELVTRSRRGATEAPAGSRRHGPYPERGRRCGQREPARCRPRDGPLLGWLPRHHGAARIGRFEDRSRPPLGRRKEPPEGHDPARAFVGPPPAAAWRRPMPERAAHGRPSSRIAGLARAPPRHVPPIGSAAPLRPVRERRPREVE